MQPRTLTNASLARAARALAQRDPDLAAVFKRHGPPPLWARKPGFSTLVQIILEQQVSLASAASLFRRLHQNTVPFRPARLIELGEVHLKSQGLTRQKTAYCLHLSESIVSGELNLARLSRLTDAEARTTLLKVKGLGPWSADVYLLMALLRPDIWPENDLALAVALRNLKGLNYHPSSRQLLEMAESWRPYRSVAARMVWQHYLADRANRRRS